LEAKRRKVLQPENGSYHFQLNRRTAMPKQCCSKYIRITLNTIAKLQKWRKQETGLEIQTTGRVELRAAEACGAGAPATISKTLQQISRGFPKNLMMRTVYT
jgi:hypothetical protein